MVKGINYQIIKGIQQIIVLKLRVPQCHQNLLAAADLFLLNGKMQFQQIIAKSPR